MTTEKKRSFLRGLQCANGFFDNSPYTCPPGTSIHSLPAPCQGGVGRPKGRGASVGADAREDTKVTKDRNARKIRIIPASLAVLDRQYEPIIWFVLSALPDCIDPSIFFGVELLDSHQEVQK